MKAPTLVLVTVRRDAAGHATSLVAAGHAGWADAGNDIVCSAVSAILQAAWLGLERVADVRVAGEKGDGTLSLGWPRTARGVPQVETIVSTAEVAIEQLAAQYPEHVGLARESEAPSP